MDPISQGILGAVASGLCADRSNIRKATLVGWAAGMLADADVLIKSASDPLLNIEYHRHFSHALLFVPLGGLLCACIFWLLTRKAWRLPFRSLFVFSFAGYATAGLLDACTSYGTRLFWPFSDARVAWNIISIIDPILTATLLILVMIGVVRKRLVCFHVSLFFACSYLLLGVVQRDRTVQLQTDLATQRGHTSMIQRTVKPSIGNLLLWRSIYHHGDQIYVDAIRTGLFGQPKVYEGVSLPVLTLRQLSNGLPEDCVLVEDLKRFDHFSDGYLAQHPKDPNVIGDLRYAVLPQSVTPLWGIRVDRERINAHVTFETFRNVTKQDRIRLLRMLNGQPLDPTDR